MKTLMKYGPLRTVPIKVGPTPGNPNTLRVTRTSDITGKEHTMDLPVTEDQLRNWLSAAGPLIQEAMPHLSKDQREFLMSGCTPEEWENTFGE